MSESYAAFIACHSTMMREAISRSLENGGMSVVCAVSSMPPPAASFAREADVGIVASGFCGEAGNDARLRMLLSLPVSNWIVLSDDRHDPLATEIAGAGLTVCAVPDDIGGAELAHVAMVVAGGSRIAVGRFCDGCTPRELLAIREADLDDSQWRLMTHLAEGHANKHIARSENTTEAAIKARIRVLLSRLRVENRTQAAVLGARAGLRLTPMIRIVDGEGGRMAA